MDKTELTLAVKRLKKKNKLHNERIAHLETEFAILKKVHEEITEGFNWYKKQVEGIDK